MINIIGTISVLLFILKAVLHIVLMAKLENSEFVNSAMSPNSIARLQTFFPFYEDVPKKLQWLKTCINVIYITSVVLLIIFLIGVNIIDRG